MVIGMAKSRVYIKRTLIHGVGVNDADYPVTSIVDGKRVKCKIYETWSNMIARCYSSAYKKGKPTYEGSVVCDQWLIFSSFKRWMDGQDWQGKCLDKDYLLHGNKIYSPETCLFIPKLINSFIASTITKRKELLCGAFFNEKTGRFYAKCSNPFTGKNINLGTFNTEREAHDSWMAKKREFAFMLADTSDCPVIAEILRNRFQC